MTMTSTSISNTPTTTPASAALLPRPPLLPWSAPTWLRWSNQGRLSTTPIPRSPFVLLKAPVSTLYEEKFGGDRNMFTVNMYCARMNAISIRIGLVVDCTALDMEEFAPLPTPRDAGGHNSAKNGRVRYFHNPAEWDDYDVDYQRLMPAIPVLPQPSQSSSTSNENNMGEAGSTTVNDQLPLAPKSLPEFYRIVSDYLHKVRSGNENSNSVTTMTAMTMTTYIALFDARGGLGAASYLAACYMCDKLKAPVHAAIEAVKVGSPPQPSKGDSSTKRFGLCDVRLMQDLQDRFKGQKEIVMEGTSYPTWWWHGDGNDHTDPDADGNDGSGMAKESGPFDHDGTTSRKRKREGATLIIPPYSSSEEGQSQKRSTSRSLMSPFLPPDILEPIPRNSPKYQRAVTVLAQLTQSPQYGDPLTHLPLREEFDMSIESATNKGTVESLLECIQKNIDGYRVTWLAAKGRRGLLLILSEAIYFMEQVEEVVSSAATNSSSSSSTTTATTTANAATISVHHVSISRVTNIRFPTSKDLTRNQHRTLLDVILVKDVEKLPKDKNNITHRFYALDVLCVEGDKVWHKPLELRRRYLNEGVLLPRKKDEALQTPLSAHNYATEAIKIRAIEYFPMSKLGYVLKEVCKGVQHEAEGVRIVPVGEYYGLVNSSSNIAITWRSGKNEFFLRKLLHLTKDAAS